MCTGKWVGWIRVRRIKQVGGKKRVTEQKEGDVQVMEKEGR